MKKWKIDPTHSEIAFKVKHLMISTVRGHFGKFEGELASEDDTFNNGIINFKTDVSSIETGNPDRNGHLLSSDFFDAEKFPVLSFTSSSVKRVADKLEIEGSLTIKDVTKVVKLEAVVNGSNTNMKGEKVTSFDLMGTINRKDFGLVWNVPLETGGVLVGENVIIEASIEAIEE